MVLLVKFGRLRSGKELPGYSFQDVTSDTVKRMHGFRFPKIDLIEKSVIKPLILFSVVVLLTKIWHTEI
jgi:hypothetical protein